MVFPANGDLAKGLDLCEEAFDFPATAIAAQSAAVLGLGAPGTVGSDEFDALLMELGIETGFGQLPQRQNVKNR